jgi:hypothetical protein
MRLTCGRIEVEVEVEVEQPSDRVCLTYYGYVTVHIHHWTRT